MLDRAEMLLHRPDGGVGISGAEGGDDLAVLVDGAVGRMRPPVQRKNERAA